MKLSAEEIAAATGGRLVRDGEGGVISTDSRKVGAGEWFLALKGPSFDGNNYAGMALEQGCVGAVLERIPDDWSRGLVLVDDGLIALQDCARFGRSNFTGAVVGITGSAGKTTTRAMISCVLSGSASVHQTLGNLNNHIGLPLTILSAPDSATVWVLEMGMSAPGEIALLQEIASPTHRLITNVSMAHSEGTGSLLGTAACKQELFDGAISGDTLVVNMDDPLVRAMPTPDNVTVLSYGKSQGCNVRLVSYEIDLSDLTTNARIDVAGEEVDVRISAPGEHIALDACAAMAVGHSLGCTASDMAIGLSLYSPVGMRMRLESYPNMVTVLNDAYNANPASTQSALSTLKEIKGRRTVALLGDMLELGDHEAEAHEATLELALECGIDILGLVGEAYSTAANKLGVKAVVAKDSVALAEQMQGKIEPGDVVLIKGSRGLKMERAIPVLFEGVV